MEAETKNDECVKRPMFGARYLENPESVFTHNTWDNVQWDAEQEEEARKKVEKQAEKKIPEEQIEEMKKETGHKWDKFYDCHQNRFFKDRHWLFTEFPELALGHQKAETPVRVLPDGSVAPSIPPNDPERKVVFLEIGCGVGNTVFPLLQYNPDPNFFIYCCDFSSNAIDILKSHPKYEPNRCCAFVCDVTAEDWNTPFAESSVDFTTLIFAFSAIPPQRMRHVVKQLFRYTRPGGLVLLRDYGRYDMAQLRFKSGQMMEDNFYIRSDGTFVYFFTQEEIREMFCEAGFIEEQNLVDRRLQVNRGRQLKMYRVWVQAKYRKPLT